ncbi:ATP-binding protein [Limnobacter sp.]|uniref:ATP-binding protein n=1 Tax=Limnobacter sp. TaxID=2003368 RepID=UPI002FE1F4B0
MINSSPKLIVVDDERAQKEALCLLLEERGFEVFGFSTPAEALDFISCNPADLLLTDLKLPGFTGIELIGKVKIVQPDLPCILMTGHGSVETAVEALNLGVQDYVLKPFKIGQVLSSIHKALKFQQLKKNNETLLQQLSTSNQQLKELNSELDSFAGRIAHDLNSVIHLIQGYASRLKEQEVLSSPEHLNRSVMRILESSQRGGKLVSDLLEFARLGASPLASVETNLNDIVHRSKVIAELDHDGPRPTWKISDLPAVPVDPALIEQVFINLFSNALKYSARKDHPVVEVQSRLFNEFACISVKDNGAGFDPELADRLFKPFQRLHDQTEFHGHGMGLANVKKIVERHGGMVKAKGQAGQGATFELYLPLRRGGVEHTYPALNVSPSVVADHTKPEPSIPMVLKQMDGTMAGLGGWSVDLEPRLKIHWSDEVFRIFEVSEEQGQPADLNAGLDRYYGFSRARLEEALERCVAEGDPIDLEAEILTFKNRKRIVRVAAKAIKNDQDRTTGIQGFIQDITEYRHALHTVNRINSLLYAQNQVNVQIPYLSSTADMFNEVCRIVPAVGQIPLVWIVSFKPGTEELQVVAKGGQCLDLVDQVMESLDIDTGHPLFQRLERRSLYICNDVRDEPYAVGWAQHAIDAGMGSFAVVPLHLHGKLFAAMVYFGFGTDFFDTGVSELLETIAKNRSLALENLVNSIDKAKTMERLQLLEACVERLNDMVLITEAEPVIGDGPKILYANPAFYESTGFTPDEVIGNTPRILQGPGTQRDVLDKIRVGLLAWKPVHEELINYTKDGKPFWIELNIVPIADQTGYYTHWVAIQRDVSERKRIEQDREVNLERFRSLANATSDCIWEWDLEDADYVWWSEGLQTLFGYLQDECGSTIESRTSRIHPDDLARVVSGIDSVLEGDQETWRDEYRFARADGTWSDVTDRAFVIRDHHGKALRMIGGMTDITHIKQVQRDSESQLRKMNLLDEITRSIGKRLDINSIYAVVINALENDLPSDFCFLGAYDLKSETVSVRSLSESSLQMAKLLGISGLSDIPITGTHLQEACTGKFVFQPTMKQSWCPIAQQIQKTFGLNSLVIVPLVQEARVLGVMVTARKAENAYSEDELKFLRQLGEHVALALSQAELLKQLQDAYEELTQTQDLVLQQERLRALAEMAAGIAHDINNAISPAALYVESLLSPDRDLPDRDRKQLTTIQTAIDDVTNTVLRMSRFAKGRDDVSDFVFTDVNALCQEAIELTRAKWETITIKKGWSIQIKTFFEENISPLNASRSEMREALTNLILNATDALPNGGVIEIHTSTATVGSTKFLNLEVRDNGVGMDEQTKVRCMEPFFTTKGDRGTGLGLSMVYGIVKRMGGTLAIDSSPGKGTRISLAFEMNSEEPKDTSPKLVSVKNTAFVIRKILLVDDDQLILDTCSSILRHAGHQVNAVSTGKLALEYLLAESTTLKPYDLVITDLGMPDMTGIELAHEIKKRFPGVPLVLMSGWGSQINQDDDEFKNIDEVVSKPPRLKQLLEVIERLTR